LKRDLDIESLDQIDYELQLIEQAHDYAKDCLEADEQLRETHKNIILQKQYEIGLQKTRRGGLCLWDWCNRYLYDLPRFSLKFQGCYMWNGEAAVNA